MNDLAIQQLHEIINDTTVMAYSGVLGYTTSDRVAEAAFDEQGNLSEQRIVKCQFWNQTIGVDKQRADELRPKLIKALNEAMADPEYGEPLDLTEGPSYIAIGAAIGSQLQAFRLMGLGEMLRFWDIITPETLGFARDDPAALQMAGTGFIMVSGYHPEGLKTPRRTGSMVPS